MSEYPLLAYLSLLLIPVGLLGFFLHQRSYAHLYRKLHARDLVGVEYKPDWTTTLGAGGCMGFIKKIKREIGLDELNADEIRLVRTATCSYYMGVPALFIFVCGMYWYLYKVPV